MNNLQIFNNQNFGEIRAVEESGKIYFCGKDVAKALGYAKPRNAIAQHCREDGALKWGVMDNLGRNQTMTFIDEGNLYRLITHSKLELAQLFESWVFDEVLPTIRRTGHYASVTEASELEKKKLDLECAKELRRAAQKYTGTYRQVLDCHIVKLLTGEFLLPLPEAKERNYSAEEVGNMLGITANRVGRIANAHNLKIAEYGSMVIDKSRYSNKEVQSFRYNNAGVERIREFL